MIPRIIMDDLIGKSFILSPQFYLRKKDARVDTEHPLLQILRLQMHLLHIHLFHGVRFCCRANLVCNGT